jgi:hypothetical protein
VQHATLVGEGTTSVSAPGPTDVTPTSFALQQNQPNPFVRSTQIHYALPVQTRVSLEVFNLQGQRVATLARGDQPPGNYTVGFGRGARGVDGERLETLPSGVYFYRLRAGAFSATRKMLLTN